MKKKSFRFREASFAVSCASIILVAFPSGRTLEMLPGSKPRNISSSIRNS